MNLAALVAHHARYHGDRIAVEARDFTATYSDFDVLVRRVAARLRAAGVGVGDLVGVRMRDTPMHLATLIGIFRLGAIELPLDWRGAEAEIGRVVTRFPPKVVVTDGGRGLPDGLALVTLDAIEDTAPDTGSAVALSNHPAVYNLTSGTTGEPKAIILTHEQFFARAAMLLLDEVTLPGDRFLGLLPLAYSNGRVIAFSLLSIGATVMMFPPLFEPRELVDFVTAHHVTALIVSPNVVRQLLAVDRGDGHLMPGLRVFMSVGSKLQPEERAAIKTRIAPFVMDYYGSTGGGPTAIISRDEEGADPTSMGRPMITVNVEVVDEEGAVTPVGTVGRIRVSGPGVTTAFAGVVVPGDEGIREGWYYPGDLGSFDDRGLLHLHGRASELIKRGGLMVYAQEVEQALRRHPGVADAAVVGTPSETLGQEVVAFVVLKTAVEEGDLTRHCRRELAPFKVPARFTIVEALPRNASGKVVKAELLKLAQAG